jgi:hypothetical protein
MSTTPNASSFIFQASEFVVCGGGEGDGEKKSNIEDGLIVVLLVHRVDTGI